MDMSLSKLRELVSDGQGGLACCSPWGPKESNMTEWLNWTEETTRQMKWASLVAQVLENLPAMQETQVQSLGQEDPLKEMKEMAVHSSILA